MASEDEPNLFTEENLFPPPARPQITVFPKGRELPTPAEEENLFRSRPPAEMRSYERTWQQKLGDMGTDVMLAAGAPRHTAQHLGGAASNLAMLAPPVAMGVGMHDIGVHGRRGDPYFKSEFPYVTDASLNMLNVIPGMGYLRRAAQAPTPTQAAGDALGVERRMPDVPNSQAHFDEGDRLFNDFRTNTPYQLKPGPVTQWTDDLLKDLTQAGHYRSLEGDKALFNAIDVLREKAATRPHLTAADIDEFRNALIKVKKAPGSGAEGAMEAQSRLFDYLERVGDPRLQKAVANWKYAEKGSIIDTVLEKADRSPGTKGVETQSRVALNARATQKWTDAEREVLDRARRGPMSAQIVDKFADVLTGRQGGLGGVASTVPVTAGIASRYGSKAGALLGAVPGISSFVSGTLSPMLKRDAVVKAGNTIRSGSPMYQDIVAANTPTYKVKSNMGTPPGVSSPGADWARRNAIVQGLMEQEGYR